MIKAGLKFLCYAFVSLTMCVASSGYTVQERAPSFWPGHIVKIEIELDPEKAAYVSFLSLFKKSEKGLTLLKRLSLGESFRAKSFEFDQANYRINDKERALGIRESDSDYGSDRYNHELTRVRLFRLTSQGLEEIFNEVVEELHQLWVKSDDKITTVEEQESHTKLILSSKKHRGNFDIELKTKSKKLKKPLDIYYEGLPENQGKKDGRANYLIKNNSKTFIWNGVRYVGK